jgi:four helix bundle protein
MARTVRELPLYGKVVEFRDAVSEILRAPGLRNDRNLYGQIERATSSIEANLTEGFEAPSDAAFAHFVFTAKGSAAEAVAAVREAHRRRYLADEQLNRIIALGEPLGKMMGGFIKYLAASGFTDRGRHIVAPTPRRPSRRKD